MKRLLVLNSGAAWSAYQIGALRCLVRERDLSFDVCAGTGMGAMNAAFIACGAFGALEAFWKRIDWLELVALNTRHPWRDGPLHGGPQARFIQQHVSEEKLRKRGATLLFSSLNLKTGREEVFTYPGGNVPLLAALMGATAVPGLTAPLRRDGQILVEGTFINSFILNRALTVHPAEEVYAVAALPVGVHSAPPKRYDTWRAVMQRTLQVNLSHDIRAEIEAAEKKIAAARAHARARERLETTMDAAVGDESLRKQLQDRLTKRLRSTSFPYTWTPVPILRKILTSQPVDFPLWRFQRSKLEALMRTGYRDATTALEEHAEVTA